MAVSSIGIARFAAAAVFCAVVGTPSAAASLAAVQAAASSGPCQPDWIPTVGPSPSGPGTFMDSVVFDDGAGPKLYVAGAAFDVGGSQSSGIARYDGVSWSSTGAFAGVVEALVVFDDGAGPKLYAGGQGLSAAGVNFDGIARFDGASWSSVGLGISGPPTFGGPRVYELAVYDDGSGPALFAGGDFGTAGGSTATRIAKWDGANWSTLGAGVGPAAASFQYVLAMTVHDFGAGPRLVVGGEFTTAGGLLAQNLATWDGATWSAFGPVAGRVEALASIDDGSGPALYVGGRFSSIGGVATSHIARWNGSSWSNLGGGVSGSTGQEAVYSLSYFDSGTGPRVHVGGIFSSAGGVASSNVARWNGGNWSASSVDDAPRCFTLTPFQLGGSSRLLVAGQSGGASVLNLMLLNSSGVWGTAGDGLDGAVTAFASFDFGSGPELVVAGSFRYAGGSRVDRIARFDGSDFAPLGAGFNDHVYDVEVVDHGAGPVLYAAGGFTLSGAVAVSHVARWNGASWQPLTTGANGPVLALQAHNDGTGEALYAAGAFLGAGGVVMGGVARWNGAAWSTLAFGLTGEGGAPRDVNALGVYNGQLVAGGRFSTVVANGTRVWGVARWNGAGWLPLGPGIDGGGNPASYSSLVDMLGVYDSGFGPELWVGGFFQGASVQDGSQRYLARWNGSAWSSVPGLNAPPGQVLVRDMRIYDDGSGAALFVAARSNVPQLRRWDGATWVNVGDFDSSGELATLGVFDFGAGADLVVGGVFTAGGHGLDHNITRWGGCALPPGPSTYCTAGTTVNGCVAEMTSAGTPSASATSGFTVGCVGVDGLRSGLVYYGVNGPKSNSLAIGSNSFLCVKAPSQRLPVQSTGGAVGTCTGMLSYDMLAYWNANPGALGAPFSAGDTLNAQAWFRDPAAVTGANLSDGLAWVMSP